MTRDKIAVLSGNAHPALARAIAEALGIELCRATVGRFPDGEIDVKVYDDLRGSRRLHRPADQPAGERPPDRAPAAARHLPARELGGA